MTPFLIKTKIYPDTRGFFKELYQKKKLNLIVNLLQFLVQKKMLSGDYIIRVKKNK